GIRDDLVTGVQTCALPIFASGPLWRGRRRPSAKLAMSDQCPAPGALGSAYIGPKFIPTADFSLLRRALCSSTIKSTMKDRARGRSEERRVGTVWRTARHAV